MPLLSDNCCTRKRLILRVVKEGKNRPRERYILDFLSGSPVIIVTTANSNEGDWVSSPLLEKYMKHNLIN